MTEKEEKISKIDTDTLLLIEELAKAMEKTTWRMGDLLVIGLAVCLAQAAGIPILSTPGMLILNASPFWKLSIGSSLFFAITYFVTIPLYDFLQKIEKIKEKRKI